MNQVLERTQSFSKCCTEMRVLSHLATVVSVASTTGDRAVKDKLWEHSRKLGPGAYNTKRQRTMPSSLGAPASDHGKVAYPSKFGAPMLVNLWWDLSNIPKYAQTINPPNSVYIEIAPSADTTGILHLGLCSTARPSEGEPRSVGGALATSKDKAKAGTSVQVVEDIDLGDKGCVRHISLWNSCNE